MKGDERILGSGDFVESILAQTNEDLERKYRLRSEGYDFDKVVDRVSDLMGLERNEVLSPGKYKKVVEDRSIVCYWAMRELGISYVPLSVLTSLSYLTTSTKSAFRITHADVSSKSFPGLTWVNLCLA
ncbi:MAG: hypothetical protein KKC23_10135 [Proteobacteria bacterium]|nr:hypothetical protein [Pseudomonadota bacterium]